MSVDSITLATVNTNSTGFFNATVEIPILSLGIHTVKVANAGCNLFFTIDVQPTLIITPDIGPVGTSTLITAYGFPANSTAYLYWGGTCTQNWIWIANATVGADGQFNVTVPWVIPPTYGGIHPVVAFTGFVSNTTFGGSLIADTFFEVTPTIWFSPATINSDGSLFFLMGTGLNPHIAYVVNIDNQAFATPDQTFYYVPSHYVFSDECGALNISLVAAGFEPGLHVGALYATEIGRDSVELAADGHTGDYPIEAYATFTVTTVGNPVITAIHNDIVTLQTSVGQIQTSVTALDAKVTSIQNGIATVQTTLGTLTG